MMRCYLCGRRLVRAAATKEVDGNLGYAGPKCARKEGLLPKRVGYLQSADPVKWGFAIGTGLGATDAAKHCPVMSGPSIGETYHVPAAPHPADATDGWSQMELTYAAR